MRQVPELPLGYYNGWSGAERLATIPVQKAALKSGLIERPTQCSICLIEGSTDPRAADAIVLHDENYAEPLDAYPVCKPCHSLIHLRFWRVDEWQAHVALHARGAAWFALLTLDAGSRFRPFVETYPAGLPRAS